MRAPCYLKNARQNSFFCYFPKQRVVYQISTTLIVALEPTMMRVAKPYNQVSNHKMLVEFYVRTGCPRKIDTV